MSKKPPKGKSLAEVNPELSKEWHPTKNGDLNPEDITAKSGQKVWWKCPKGEDHEWETKISARSNGTNCPVCSNKLIVNSNCLATTNPKLALEWNKSKNLELTPYLVGRGSHKKVWWKCKKGHEWQAVIKDRNSGVGCPYCSGKKSTTENSLGVHNPKLAKQWHPTKNGGLQPADVLPKSRKKVWWKCPKGEDHEWEAVIGNRNNGAGCPICSGFKVSISNCLKTLMPELAKEWHPTKNGLLKPSNVTLGNDKKVWWKCKKGHEWQASTNTRSQGVGCPYCSGHKTTQENSLAYCSPKLAKQWHPTKNGTLTPYNVSKKSNKKIWWKCEKGEDHIWKATVQSRFEGNGCPICSGFMAVKSNSLGTLNPKLSDEWHHNLNGSLSPFDVRPNSNKKVWWKCPKGEDHEWEADVNSRTNGNGCPVCRGLKVVKSNSLETLNPKLASEWHYEKNENLTPSQVTLNSGKKVWWKCHKDKTHIWRVAIAHRANGRGCPFCTLTPQSRQELQITFELKQFFQINPKGFKTRIAGKLWSIDIYLEELNLGIEFDGSYWHKDKRDLDKLKTQKLKEEGFQIMRIREEPLKAITDIDVISKLPFNAKKVTNDILKHILEEYDIDSKRQGKIKEYFRKRKLQNEEALDLYIESVLLEKAKRSKK